MIWEDFVNLQPVVRLLINEAELRHFGESIDWQRESDRYRNPQVIYPEYYNQQKFHGLAGGYLNPQTAVSYDAITQYLIPPQETLVRQTLSDRIPGLPQRILDLGCGTGSSTLILQQKFPQASITGMDLSPLMLVMAHRKAKQAPEIHWQQGHAQYTGFPSGYFDLVTASWLFQETPVEISQAIVKECFRILKGSGQLLILDKSQLVLRSVEWLTEIFPESVVQDKPTGSFDAWLGAAGFEAVSTEEIWLVHQITMGFKPQPVQKPWSAIGEELDNFDDFAGGFA